MLGWCWVYGCGLLWNAEVVVCCMLGFVVDLDLFCDWVVFGSTRLRCGFLYIAWVCILWCYCHYLLCLGFRCLWILLLVVGFQGCVPVGLCWLNLVLLAVAVGWTGLSVDGLCPLL